MPEQTADTQAPIVETGTKAGWNGPLPVIAVLLLVAAALGRAHFVPAGPAERDGYFHARYAQMFFKQGLSRSFPWTQASTWKDTFCDKEFLFHALMAPFCQSESEPIQGARAFALLLGVGVCALLYLVLRAQQVPYPWLFALLPICMGAAFFERFIMIRSHLLSLLLCVATLYFLARKNWKALAALGFVYAWSYTFPFVMLMFGAPFVAGRWLRGDGLDWRSAAAIAGGVTAGLVLHPFSPYTLETFLTYLQVITMGFQGQKSAAMAVGAEIYSPPLADFLRNNPLTVVAVLLLGAGVWNYGKKLSSETWGACATAFFWLVMSLIFARFIEYLVPVGVFALGLVARDAIADFEPVKLRTAIPPVLGGALLLLLAGHIDGVYINRNPVSKGWEQPPRYRAASEWMAKNLKPGETVVNLFWEDFPELFYDGFRQRYLWGLDPTYTLRWHEKKALLLQSMGNQSIPLNGAILAQLFDARVMILPRQMAATFKQLDQRNIPPWKPVYVDSTTTIFVLAGPQGQPPEPAPLKLSP